ncbi:RDD family protein [Mycolicibacterium arseniciresistens]|uniref:RDD family protein n=1 Tax=Mycolicibacterium arseniciresistens TaxID=3062257 RepID=UPI002E1FC27D
MSEQPPPPSGNLPPPPPPGGNYPPPPPPQGGGYPPPQGGSGYPSPQGSVLPQEAYTSWGTRVLAWLIDYVPVIILTGIGYGLLMGTRETECITDSSEYQMGEFCAEGASTLGQLSFGLFGVLLPLAYGVWNYGYRQGTTGSSIGKSVMKFKVVSEKTWQPIGFGLSLVREIIYWVASAACGVVWLVAVLFPLWDPKRQSLADKIMTTVCVPLDQTPGQPNY